MRARSILSLPIAVLVVQLSLTAAAQDATKRRELADRLVGPGLRRIASVHLVLYTDLEAAPEVDEIPEVFDRAVPQWCKYFGVAPREVRGWQMTGYVMKNAEKFRSAGLIPRELPDFRNGYQVGDEFWVHEQPSAYYRRHLVLHEGTHAFMHRWLGDIGPPWLAEGVAEYLATHRWNERRLELGYVPVESREVPGWGRVKIIKDAVAADRGLSLPQVLAFGPRAHLEVEPYGWCWAAVLLLEQHPSFHDVLHEQFNHLTEPPEAFAAKLQERSESGWREAELNWHVMLHHMDYGYDVRSAAVQLVEQHHVVGDDTSVSISAKAGWQDSGLQLEAGKTYEVTASGRFQIAKRSKPWPCEPGGVTIEYYRGRPLGMLLAAIVPDDQPERIREPLAIGLGSTVEPEVTGSLFFCVNENPAELADNAGTLQVTVKRTLTAER